MHPSVERDTYFVAFSQMGPGEIGHPIVFIARCLTVDELKYGMLTTLVSVVTWKVEKLH